MLIDKKGENGKWKRTHSAQYDVGGGELLQRSEKPKKILERANLLNRATYVTSTTSTKSRILFQTTNCDATFCPIEPPAVGDYCQF
jgi:hypothetical protein